MRINYGKSALLHTRITNGFWKRTNYNRPFNNDSRKFRNIIAKISIEDVKPGLVDNQPLLLSRLIKPTIFTVVFSSSAFASAAIWQYENMREQARLLFNTHKKWLNGTIKARSLWTKEQNNQKEGSLRQAMNDWWNTLSPGQKVFVPILFANVLVFVAWKFPAYESHMIRYFTSNPATKVICWPMLLSTFSHYSGFHLGANMFVLNSFINGIVGSLGMEQFVAFYVSGGVIASLFSHYHKVMSLQPAMSLGASGAVMAVIAYISTKYPDTLLSIIFLPFVTFKAGVAIKAIMAIDAAGLILKWKLFDHAAHLGGAIFGLFWFHYGQQHIWQNRKLLIEWWNKVRPED